MQSVNEHKERKERLSNFELLRVLSMFAIVLYHIVEHSVISQLTDANYIASTGDTFFDQPIIYKRLFLIYTIEPVGPICNAIFILISGYFLVRREEKINIAKTTKNLIFQQFYAAVILTIVSAFLYVIAGTKGVFINTMTISNFNFMTWFAGYYFLIILIAYLFLNRFLATLSRKNYSAFLIVILGLSQFMWSGALIESVAAGLRTLFLGIFLYSLGGYIERYQPFAKLKAWFIWIVIVLSYICIYISAYNNAALNIENSSANISNGTFVQSFAGYYNFNLIIVILAVCVFELFRRVTVPCNKLINFLGSTTFMIYLVHDNSLFYSIWSTQRWTVLLHENLCMFIGDLMLWTVITYFLGIITYVSYLLLKKIINNSKKIFIS